MNSLLRTLAIVAAVASLLLSNPGGAQILPPIKKAARVKIIKGPELEMSVDQLTVIRWTTNNPKGLDVHYGVVHYGTDPKNVCQTSKSPTRLNRGHANTIFRVRLDDLKPQTTYYYQVDSEDPKGQSDRAKSRVKKFTTAAPGERIVNYRAIGMAPPTQGR